jgi:long-chain acyl-CoA synthetase
MNIVSEILKRHPDDHLALLHEGGALTFGQLREHVTLQSQKLRAHPAWPQVAFPRIALSHPSGPDYIIHALAILHAGGCFLPIPDELTQHERHQLLTITSAHALLTADGHLSPLDPTRPPSFLESEFAQLSPAFIRFSSGTTGRAKGIILSHATLLARITAANAALGITPGDRVLWMLPMAHHFAVSIILYLYFGATTVLVPSGNAAGILQPSRQHQVSLIYGSPYHFAMLAAEPDAAPLSHLRLAVSTAFPLPESTARAFQLAYGLPLHQGLGIIEAGLPLLNLDAAEAKPTSIGRCTPAFEARLHPTSGELFIRGPGMLDAYLSPWQTQSTILQDGWLGTGDIADQDAEGHYYLRGRTRTVINVGGLKCFPEEIEHILCKLPAVSAARVHARPHPGLGAVPIAEIVLHPDHPAPTPPQFRRHCQQHLAAYKIPLLFHTVSHLPLTPSGKIRRVADP